MRAKIVFNYFYYILLYFFSKFFYKKVFDFFLLEIKFNYHNKVKRLKKTKVSFFFINIIFFLKITFVY